MSGFQRDSERIPSLAGGRASRGPNPIPNKGQQQKASLDFPPVVAQTVEIGFRRRPVQDQWSGRRLQGIELNEARLDARPSPLEQQSRSRFDTQVQRAIKAGFSEQEAPFAASARLSRGPTTVAKMRAHLRASVPSLYEGEAA